MDLLNKTGLEEEWYQSVRKLEKKFRNRDEFDDISDRVYQGQKQKLKQWIRQYRAYLTRYYEDQRFRPFMNFVPINEKEYAIWIQNMVDVETLRPILGDFSDYTLAIETMAAWTKPMYDMHREAIKMAKVGLLLPGVRKDLKDRLGTVAGGKGGYRPQLPEYV